MPTRGKLARNGARFSVALAQLDALTVLPDAPSTAHRVDAARDRFEVIKSPALPERLEQALEARTADTLPAAAPAQGVDQAAT